MNQQPGFLRRLGRKMRRADGWVSTPILTLGALFLLLAAVQTALVLISWIVADGAASAGYSMARSYEASSYDGQAAATQIIQNQRGFLTNPSIDVTRDATSVSVTVTGTPPSLIPGITLPAVKGSSTGPIEQWVPAP